MPELPQSHGRKTRKHDTRENSNQRGYTYRWRQARERFLQKHPLCRHCENEGYLEPANVVDHITPHKGDQSLFWDQDNWQSLCKRHHDQKTVKEDGGFGV